MAPDRRHGPRCCVLGVADMPAYRRRLRPCLPARAACHPPWPLSGQAPSSASALYRPTQRVCAVVEVDRHLVEAVKRQPPLDGAQHLWRRVVRALRHLDLPRTVALYELDVEAAEELLRQGRGAVDVRQLDANRRHRLLRLVRARPIAVHVQRSRGGANLGGRVAGSDGLLGEQMNSPPLVSSRAAEDLECLVGLEPESLGEAALRLLDHDPRLERLFELAVALREQLHEGYECGRRPGGTIGTLANCTHCRTPWSPITAATASVSVGSMRNTRTRPVISNTFRIRRSLETSTRSPPRASSRVSVLSNTPSTVESINAAHARSTTIRRAPAAVSSDSSSSSCGAVKRSTSPAIERMYASSARCAELMRKSVTDMRTWSNVSDSHDRR